MGGSQPWRWLLPCLLLLHDASWAHAKLLRAPPSDDGASAGAGPQGGSVVHFIYRPERGVVDFYGFRLSEMARKRGEILWASDWEPLELDVCSAAGLQQCKNTTEVNSATREGVFRSGIRVPADLTAMVLRAVLRSFKVDIFHASLGLHTYARSSLYNGPFATLDLPTHSGGEARFFSFAMALLATMGKNILLLSSPDGFAVGTSKEAWQRKFQETVLQSSHPTPPLQYCWRNFGPPNHCEERSVFPESCIVTAFDAWGSDANVLHVTPDRARLTGQATASLPISIGSCHAEKSVMRNPNPEYVLLYGKAKKSEWVDEALFKASPLPVKVMSKYGQCPYDHDRCINVTDTVVEFHNVLRKARIVVAPYGLPDGPSLLEAAACGTPVVLEEKEHLMLEKFGSSPHVFIWKTEEDLLRHLEAAMQASKNFSNHKLPAWQPEPLRIPTMKRGLEALLSRVRKDCLLDTAELSPSSPS